MQIHELVAKFRQLHTLATAENLPEPPHATNADIEGKPLPITWWETESIYHDDVLVSVQVHPVVITRFGILHDAGATAPSISFRDKSGIKCVGSPDLFFTTRELAQADADRDMAWTKKEAAIRELKELVITDLPKLLERFET